MAERDNLTDKVRALVAEVKAKYGTWDRCSEETGVSRKSLLRYHRKKNLILPSLETYEILCRSVGRHCYPETDDGDGSFFLPFSLYKSNPRGIAGVFFLERVSPLGLSRERKA